MACYGTHDVMGEASGGTRQETRHSIMPLAGRMCPKTKSSGIFRTKRSRAVSVSRLTRMFVPKPKNVFQSPGVHSVGCAVVMGCLVCRLSGDVLSEAISKGGEDIGRV